MALCSIPIATMPKILNMGSTAKEKLTMAAHGKLSLLARYKERIFHTKSKLDTY
jgi:hypothetical protein